MSQDKSVSPLEQDSIGNSAQRGDGVSGRVGESSGDTWDNMMRPFDQDAEEQEVREESEEKEEESGEAARVKMIAPGYHPTAREIAEHMVNHLPYRAWCKHCING